MFGRVTTDKLNVRSFPGNTGAVVGTLSKNSLIDIRGQDGGWYRFDYNASSAYVFGRYIEKVNNIKSLKGRVTTDRLNVRSHPSTEASIVGVINLGMVVNIVDEDGDWLETRFNDQAGYVHKNYIELIESGEQNKGRVTTGLLNVRGQPSPGASLLGQLTQDTIVNIIAEVNDWFEIKFDGASAFVSGKYIQRIESGKEEEGPHFYQKSHLRQIQLNPDDVLSIPSDKEGRRTAQTWNDYGNLIRNISDVVGIDVGCAIAVLCVESSGQGFNAKNANRMVIRFENHQFWRRWGKFNQDVFIEHFKYDDDQPWKKHQFRENSTDEWDTFHGNQAKEWQVLDFARSLDDTAALKSISMGAPQVMGFNHKQIGYESVQQMFNNFAKDIRYHIFALFDFLDNRMISALRDHDFVKFASYYNGRGQAEDYGRWIREHYEAFEKFNV